MKQLYLFFASIFLFFNLYAQPKTPEEFLGYTLGERFTPYHRVADYFEHVAANTSHIRLETYGESYEHRPLMAAFIASPENIDRLEEIRKANMARTGLSGAADNTAAYEDIAIVWLSYNVHGNEAVSTEASMRVLYELASLQNSQAQQWLKNTVVIIDPCVNPDGRERYVQWYHQKAGSTSNPSPDAWEHHEPWPGGRMNHYLFDLNRDWAWATQKETRERLALYNQWFPHIHADYHEQSINSPYYFAPAAEPFHELITDWQRDFQQRLGENNARYFDEEGWLYFTKERFDLLYPSYGDTYPIFNGAIGMTFEQGGSGQAGLAVITEAKDTLTLKDRIAHHVTTSLSTIEVSAGEAAELVQQFTRFYRQSGSSPAGAYKTFVIKQEEQTGKTEALKALLDTHRIRYRQSNGRQNLSGFSYRSGREQKFQLQKGDLIVSAYQPKSVLLQVLFEPEAKLVDSITYDITAWSVPYAYDLHAYAVSSRLDAGAAADEQAFTPMAVPEDVYAFVAPWQGLQDARFLSRLLQQQVKVRYAMYDFAVNGKQNEAGSLIITRADNEDMGDAFSRSVVETANRLQQNITAVTTGMVAKGYDIGSGEVRFIEPPQVVLLAGESTSPYGMGEIWHFFEQQIGYPLTIVNAEDLGSISLYDYNTLIMPDGNYEKVLEEVGLESWIQNGGKVIALEKALAYFEKSEQYALKEYADEEEKKAVEEKKKKDRNQLASYASRERREISSTISGSIFSLRLDNTHPLALGYPNYYYSLKTGSDRYAYLPEGWNVGTIQSRNALVSGFAGADILSRLPESLVFGVEEKGQGSIVYMADNPLFRAFWHNGKLLFANALFLVGQE